MAAKASDRNKLAALREQLPACSITGYFNTGTNGPLARSTVAAFVDTAQDELANGRISPGVFEQHAVRRDAVRETLATLFGGHADEYAITQSTNDGLNIALHGMTWHEGDEIVTTGLEHPSLFMPLALLARRFGVKTRVADIGDGGGDVVSALAAHIGPRTRAIALSHVLWSSGAILDLRPIADLAHTVGALLIVDGAQSIGQVAVDIHETGADAYTISGQKWLCGPEGSGAVYIRRERLVDFAPSAVRYGVYDPSGYFVPAVGARRYEMGEHNPAVLAAFDHALRLLRDEVGTDWAFARIATLGKRLSDSLGKIKGVTLHSPPGKFAGLVCFNIGDLAPAHVAQELYERGFTIRYVAAPPGPVVARASTGWWNTEDEVDALAGAVAEIAATVEAPMDIALADVAPVERPKRVKKKR